MIKYEWFYYDEYISLGYICTAYSPCCQKLVSSSIAKVELYKLCEFGAIFMISQISSKLALIKLILIW